MKKSRSRAQERRFWGKIFTFPSFIVVCLFAFYPVLRTLYLSFCEYNFGFDASPVFIGVENYVRMFSDSKFLLALENTASYAVIDFILMLVLSLAIALLLFFKGKHTWFFRTAVFTPIVVPISLTCILFSWMLSGSFGIVNQFLSNTLGMPQLAHGWLTDEKTAMIWIVIVSVWNRVGFPTILFLSGLQNISEDILEAAEIDGATGFRKIFRVILPNLRETYVVVGMWIIMQALKVFVEPMVLTAGGPHNSTLVLYQYIYNTAFSYWDMGYASAMAFVLSGLILFFSLLNMKLTSGKD